MGYANRLARAGLALCMASCICAPSAAAWAAQGEDGAADDVAAQAATSHVTRLSGEESVDTAAAIARATFASADTVVLATDSGFADAMSATGLAGALDAPILLTERGQLSAAAHDAIRDLGATNVVIVGGPAVVSSDVAADVAELLGTTVDAVEANRIYGNEAEDTSTLCAAELTRMEAPQDKAIVASSVNFQDALSISSFAYKYHVPIFLESAGSTSADRQLPGLSVSMLTGNGYYSDADVYVPGGTGAVSKESVEGTLGTRQYTRMFGNDGYDTSNAIANRMVELGFLAPDNAIVASGAQAAKGTDAIAGAALGGKLGTVILLSNGNSKLEDANTVTIDGFITKNAANINNAYALGGTVVVPNKLVQQVNNLIK